MKKINSIVMIVTYTDNEDESTFVYKFENGIDHLEYPFNNKLYNLIYEELQSN